jgi:ferric-dicitrate binding protein FerR (iron transport regulator)
MAPRSPRRVRNPTSERRRTPQSGDRLDKRHRHRLEREAVRWLLKAKSSEPWDATFWNQLEDWLSDRQNLEMYRQVEKQWRRLERAIVFVYDRQNRRKGRC